MYTSPYPPASGQNITPYAHFIYHTLTHVHRLSSFFRRVPDTDADEDEDEDDLFGAGGGGSDGAYLITLTGNGAGGLALQGGLAG